MIILRCLRGHRGAAILTLVLVAHGCMTWKQGSGGSRETLAENPKKVRITLSDGRRVELNSPVLQGDSLVGSRSRVRVAVPLDDVRSVEVRRVSVARTVLLTGAGVTALIIALNVAEDDPPPQPPPSNGPASCPLVYSWDGKGWRLDSGTFAGAITAGLARTDVDVLDHAAATDDGIIRLKVANQLAETDYLDAVRLLAVDHDPGSQVAPTGNGSIVMLGSLQKPVQAHDSRGRDVLPRLANADGWSWESSLSVETPARDGVELEFRRPPGAIQARLVVEAHNTPWAAHLLMEYLRAHGDALETWYANLDANPGRAQAFFRRIAHDAFLEVSTWTATGWRSQGLAWEAGPEIVKRQAVPLDLRGIEGESLRVRLEAPASFWLIDHVAIDFGPAKGLTVTELAANRARTRAGRDVLPEIATPDARTWTIETGDWAEIRFTVPDVPSGRTRTYLLASTGWYRLNARREGPPDEALLARFEHERGAIPRIAQERRERALAALEQGR